MRSPKMMRVRTGNKKVLLYGLKEDDINHIFQGSIFVAKSDWLSTQKLAHLVQSEDHS